MKNPKNRNRYFWGNSIGTFGIARKATAIYGLACEKGIYIFDLPN